MVPRAACRQATAALGGRPVRAEIQLERHEITGVTPTSWRVPGTLTQIKLNFIPVLLYFIV